MAKKGNGIFLVYTDIDPKFDEEFNAWYNTEHLGELLSLPGFLDAARWRRATRQGVWPSRLWATRCCGRGWFWLVRQGRGVVHECTDGKHH